MRDEEYSFASAEIEMVPSTTTKIEDEMTGKDGSSSAVEEHDDVQNVWHNWEQ